MPHLWSGRFDTEPDPSVFAFGVSLGWNGAASGVGLSWRRVDGDTDRLRYDELRGFAWKSWGKAQAALDLMDVLYDAAVNGEDSSLVGSLSLSYDVAETLRVAAAVEYASTPDYDEEVSGSLKVVYRFAAAFGGRGGSQ